MRSIALPALLTTVALLGQATALAGTVSSTATLSNFRITLVDLNPDDGIAPALSFVGEGEPPFSSYAWGRATLRSLADGSELFNDYYQISGPTAPFSDAAGSSSNPNAVAVSSLEAGADRLGPHTFSAVGSAGAPLGMQASYYAGAAAPGYINLTYSVTPYTLVKFDGDVVLEAGVVSSDPSDQSSAKAELFAYGQGGLTPSQSSRDLLGISADMSQPWSTVSRAMSASFLNDAGGTITGQLVVSVYVSGMATSAVPEASALGLVLAGGGVVGAAGARRQRRARIAKRACTNSKA